MISRRQFLLGAVGLAAAPAIVKAENLMKLWVPKHYLEFNIEPGILGTPTAPIAGYYNLSFWAARSGGDWFKYNQMMFLSDLKDGKVRIDMSQVRDVSCAPGTIISNHPLVITAPQIEAGHVVNRIINPSMRRL